MVSAFQSSGFQLDVFQIDAVIPSLSRPRVIEKRLLGHGGRDDKAKLQAEDWLVQAVKRRRAREERDAKVKREFEILVDDEWIIMTLLQADII